VVARGWAAVGRRRGGACCRSASRIGDWRGTENRGLRIGCLSIVCNYLTVGGQGCVAHIWGSKVLAGVKRSKANRGFGGGERGLCVSHDCGRGGQSDTLWRFRRCDGDHGTHTCGMSSRVRFTAVASFDQDKTLTTMPFLLVSPLCFRRAAQRVLLGPVGLVVAILPLRVAAWILLQD
jgi:hypothetical protein